MVAGMLMPLLELRAIYEVLFKDGVMVAKKDKRPQTKHPEIEGVSNLQVIRAMGSLKSRGYVKETFAWRHFYWYLTNEGIVYLRDYLHLPPEIVPASLQRIRKPAATLAVAHRARVQSVEGPTSYVPKPGRRGESESQESLSERQGYRHRMMGPGEKESYTDRTPRFRGRPLAAEPVRPIAAWEVEDQPQPLSRRGDNFRSEAVMMEESRLKRVSRQQPDVSSEKPVTTSQERRVFEVQKQKAPMSVQSQKAAWKQDASQTTVTSMSSKTALPLTVAAVAVATGAATSKIQAEPSSPKTNKEKLKIADEKASMKPREMVTSNSAITTLPATELKEEKMQKVIVDPIKSAEVKPSAKTATDNMKAQAVITMETSKLLTDTNTSTTVITVCKDVKEEKIKRAKVNGEPVKPVEVKTQVESKIDHEKDKKTAKGTVTQVTTKPLLSSTTGEPVLSTDAVKEICKVKVTQKPIDAKVTSVNLSAKPKTDEAPPKTTMVESSILEVKTTISTTTLSAPVANAEDAKPVKGGATVTETITKQEKTNIKVTTHVKKDEKIVPEDVLNVSEKGAADSSSPQLNQNVATTEEVMETKQVVEGSSKSKRKKKKSPGEILKSSNAEELPDSKSEKEKPCKDKPPEEVAENTLQPTPVITSEPLTVCTSMNTEGPVKGNKTQAKIGIDGGKIKKQTHENPIMEIPKQTEDQSISEVASLQLDQIPTVPPVELPDDAQVKAKVEESNVSKITHGPICSKDKLNAKLPHTEPVKSEEMTVTKVETVTVQKLTQVQLIQASPKPEGKSPASASESQKPTVETKSLTNKGQAAEESSKGKKKGRGKKHDTINTKPEAEALPSTNMTSLPKATVKDSCVTTSEVTELNVSPKMTPERMCSEETRQAAAVLCEAPADKGEVEPALPFAEKIKREVPKPKTSSTAREAPAAEELASAAAAAAAAAQAAEAPAQASPLDKQEEPPRVAQHSASQAAERSTEKKLSVSEALKQEEEKKRDLEEDTPSVTATPATTQSDQLHLVDTCESVSPDTDEAAMKRKIVVVEEIVEVKQVISPDATGAQSPPPPVQREEEGEGLDLDVLEQIAIERALLSGLSGARVEGASPEEEWDHSLEEPEEKSWPNFIEDELRSSSMCGLLVVDNMIYAVL
ncbi:fibrous sheath CABYR-binding protein-like [Sander lucioperca]|uniref:fibrous sheath CABYR-binding protein-like n=1 Tax=Sander lucioperca TaxID=283035 RepID=UPI00125D9814|nr:fibrous sheath CABYR-binding protein-like [Sander lucioperca]